MDKLKKGLIIIALGLFFIIAIFTVIYSTVYINGEDPVTIIKGQEVPKDKKIVGYYFSRNNDLQYAQLNAVFENNQVHKNLFILKYHDEYSIPEFRTKDNTVYVVFKGDRQLAGHKELYLNKTTGNLETKIGDSTGHYYSGDIYTGELNENKKENEQKNKLYNDLFINKDNEGIIIEEKNTTTINSLSSFITSLSKRWQTSVGYVYSEKSESKEITGISPLLIEGYYDEKTDTYYYPSLDGIYKSQNYKQENSNSKKLLNLNLNNHEDVKLIKNGNEFILIKESIPVTDKNAKNHYSERKVEIIKYDNSFKEMDKIELKGRVDTVTKGKKGVIIAYGEGPETDGTINYNYINYSNLKVTNLGKEKVSYTNGSNKTYDIVRSNQITFIAPTYVYNSIKKEFVKMDTNQNKAIDTFKE